MIELPEDFAVLDFIKIVLPYGTANRSGGHWQIPLQCPSPFVRATRPQSTDTICNADRARDRGDNGGSGFVNGSVALVQTPAMVFRLKGAVYHDGNRSMSAIANVT
jgi:hypothetical protein